MQATTFCARCSERNSFPCLFIPFVDDLKSHFLSLSFSSYLCLHLCLCRCVCFMSFLLLVFILFHQYLFVVWNRISSGLHLQSHFIDIEMKWNTQRHSDYLSLVFVMLFKECVFMRLWSGCVVNMFNGSRCWMSASVFQKKMIFAMQMRRSLQNAKKEWQCVVSNFSHSLRHLFHE